MAPKKWTEAALSEDPAVAALERLGFKYVPSGVLDAERDAYKEPVLAKRLRLAIERLNPHLTPENVGRAVRTITHAQGTSLAEVNQALHVAITHGVTVQQDMGHGAQGQTVRAIDFDNPLANELIVTRQFKLKGSTKHIKADTVVFVNGLPLAVMELKNPTLGDAWLHDAVDQLLRYQEGKDEYRDQGAPQLFNTVQLLVAACGLRAAYGTVGTPQRFFAEWKTAHPALEQEVAAALGHKPTPQDIALWGLFQPANLLDIVRSFVVYENDPKSARVIHKLPRYPQFLAVNKAIARIKSAKRPDDRGGVIWHTQGSGKSLTMLWLALKLRRDPAFEHPTIVIVTDRTDLDDQISGTFQAAGFPNPDRAESVRDLREKLSGPTGITVSTTVQKFQDLAAEGARGEHPVLNDAENVFVLVDEAHRTQYRSLAANMRLALPRACFLGFTGTPIDRNDRSTRQTFGPYIDTYTIDQAVQDGATVPIFYESRLPKIRIVGGLLDKMFDQLFSDRSPEERVEIKRKYGTEAAVATAPRRIEAICSDLIEHFTRYIQPNGFKAQVVAVSREAAVLYKETLDKLNSPPSAVIMSSTNDDPAHLAKYALGEQQRKDLIQRFKKPSDPLAILVVCDMLITGFDAPVEQVMYLDSPLKEHTLLQAIARVNRKGDDKKTYGLVIDYWGVSDALKEALAIFSPQDVQGAMKPRTDVLPQLQARHAAAMRFMAKVKRRDDLDACVALLEPDDIRAEFDQAFRAFSAALDIVLPDPAGLPYVADLKWLGQVRQAARARYRDHRLDVSDCGAKVKKLIEDSIAADGIELLVKEVSLFSTEFAKKVDALPSPEAKASEMEHAIRHEIHVRLEENPAFYESLRDKLQKIIEDREAERIDAAKQLELLKVLAAEVKNEASAAQDAGLTDVGFAIYGVIDRALPAPAAGEPVAEYRASRQKLAALVEEALSPYVEIPGWTDKQQVQKEMRRAIKDRLLAAQVLDAGKRENIASDILNVAKVRRGR